MASQQGVTVSGALHVKLTGVRWGEQECWDPDTEAGQFLKTPLLDELKALKKLLMAPVSDQAALAMLTPRRAQQPPVSSGSHPGFVEWCPVCQHHLHGVQWPAGNICSYCRA